MSYWCEEGCSLFIFSSLFHFYRLDITQILDWNIFTLIGTMYLVVALIGGIHLRGAVSGICLVVLANSVLPMGAPAILRGGSFAPIPFASYFFFGVALTELSGNFSKAAVAIVVLCLVAVVAGSLIYLLRGRILNLARFDVWSDAGILTICSLFLFAFLLLTTTQTLRPISQRVLHPLVLLGRLSFSLYYVQHALLVVVPGAIGHILHQEIIMQLPTTLWFLGFCALLGLLYLVAVVWGRFGFKLSLEWFINNYISKRSLFVQYT